MFQKDEDFCDDLNFLSESEQDLLIIENVFERFEAVSGAILSRSSKSKVMGLGPWRQKDNWVLPWLQVKDELKIFGFKSNHPTSKLLTGVGGNVLLSTR